MLKSFSESENYLFSLFILVSFLAVVFTGMILFIGLDHPFWSSDEKNFYNTIIFFSKHPPLKAMTDYRQLVPPMFFLIYSSIGKITGLGVANIRVLIIATALMSHFIMHRTLFIITENALKSAAGAALVIINPYVIGTSFFIFTDITAFLFGAAAVLCVLKKRPFQFMVWSCLALLTRQYMIFLIIPCILLNLLKWYHTKNHESKMFISSGLLSLLPYFIMTFIWKGPAPHSGQVYWLHRAGIESGFGFHPSYIVGYIAFIAVYALPFIILFYRKLWPLNIKLVLISTLISPLYLFFPVVPSEVSSICSQYQSTGLFHRLTRFLLQYDFAIHTVFFLFFFTGMVIILYLVFDTIHRIRTKNFGFILYSDMCILFFLLVMSFSFQFWEKYIYQVVLLLAYRTFLLKGKSL